MASRLLKVRNGKSTDITPISPFHTFSYTDTRCFYVLKEEDADIQDKKQCTCCVQHGRATKRNKV